MANPHYFSSIEYEPHLCSIDDNIVKYDGCANTSDKTLEQAKEFYSKKYWKYIGKGKIHSIGGILQSGIGEYYFFNKL